MSEHKWLRLESDNNWQIIVPDGDIKPHAKTVLVFPEGEMEGELAEYDCPCNPAVDFINKIIIHNAFDGRE